MAVLFTHRFDGWVKMPRFAIGIDNHPMAVLLSIAAP
jgi:hypothetical protein